MKTIHIGFLLAAVLAVSACQSGGNNQSTSATPASEAPAADVPGVANNRLQSFVPPSDGKLTAAQVEQYIAVRRRALQRFRAGKPGASLVSTLTEITEAETRAAGELGRDVAEYRWVQARISEVSSPALPEGSADVLKAIEASAMMRSAELQKAAADERRVAAPVAADAAATAFNRSVIEPFRSELEAVEKS